MGPATKDTPDFAGAGTRPLDTNDTPTGVGAGRDVGAKRTDEVQTPTMSPGRRPYGGEAGDQHLYRPQGTQRVFLFFFLDHLFFFGPC